MSDNFISLISSREVRYARQLDYALQMISQIAVSYDDAVDQAHDDIQLLGVRAMLDVFYVNVRLMGDFLVKKTSSRKGMEDFGPADLGVTWEPVEREPDGQGSSGGSAAQRLHQYWDDASKFVVHFSAHRVPEHLDDLNAFNIGSPHFRKMATDVVLVFATFLQKLINTTPTWTEGAWIPDERSEPEDFNARKLHERTQILVESFYKACCRLGLEAGVLINVDER